VSALLPSLAAVVTRGPLRWSDAPASWVVALLVLGILGFAAWTYRRERASLSPGARLGLAALRAVALLLPLLALFGPYREETRKVEEKSHLVVLVDTSASMNTQDRYAPDAERRLLEAAYPDASARPGRLDLSRLELVQRIVSADVLRRLEERFVLHVFAFDEELRSLGVTEEKEGGGEVAAAAGAVAAAASRALEAARAAGGRTEVGAALKGVWRDFVGREDRRLGGVVLFSDGRDNSETQRPAEAIAALGRSAEDLRLTAVALGDPRLAKNLKVDSVGAKDVVLVRDDVGFLAVLRHTGFTGVRDVEVRLEIDQIAGPDGKALAKPTRYVPPASAGGSKASVKVALLPEGDPTPANLRARFDVPGTFDVRVHAVLPGDLAKEDAIREDDAMVHRLRVVDQTIKVLVADWGPRHETHFLTQLLVRESRQETDAARMDAQVFIQSFDRDVEQPHGSKVPALKSFPTTRQEIFSYDVIVIGDVNWRTLAGGEEASRKVVSLLKEFVAEGGGIAFVAGEDRNPTQYLDTPLQDLLPVVVQAQDRAHEPASDVAFRVAPTDVGLTHPILAVVPDATPQTIDDWWRRRDGWDWYWMYRASGGLKPGAQALARVAAVSGPEWRDERQEPLPVFAVMTYGKGRTFFSAIDMIYRIRKEHGDAYYGAFWDETIRWLATYRLLGGNKRFKIQTDHERYYVGETATITVLAYDADFQPLSGATLPGLQVEDPDGRTMLGPDDAPKSDPEGGPGVFKTQVRLPRSGAYRIYVDPPTRDGGARAEKRIEAAFATKEDQDTIPDHETLRLLVKLCNPGAQEPRLHSLADVPALVEGLPARTTERETDRRDVPLWDNAWTLLAAVALLGLEWALRKRLQLI
jgi:hypothetical protein